MTKTPCKIVILPLLIRVACDRLQIGTDLLLIITSTADELSKNTESMTLNDSEPTNYKVLVNFCSTSCCDAHLKIEFWSKLSETDRDNLYDRASHEHQLRFLVRHNSKK